MQHGADGSSGETVHDHSLERQASDAEEDRLRSTKENETRRRRTKLTSIPPSIWTLEASSAAALRALRSMMVILGEESV